jgi:hypothetical protein
MLPGHLSNSLSHLYIYLVLSGRHLGVNLTLCLIICNSLSLRHSPLHSIPASLHSIPVIKQERANDGTHRANCICSRFLDKNCLGTGHPCPLHLSRSRYDTRGAHAMLTVLRCTRHVPIGGWKQIGGWVTDEELPLLTCIPLG